MSERIDAQNEYLEKGDEATLHTAFGKDCYTSYRHNGSHELLFTRPQLKQFLAVVRKEVTVEIARSDAYVTV